MLTCVAAEFANIFLHDCHQHLLRAGIAYTMQIYPAVLC